MSMIKIDRVVSNGFLAIGSPSFVINLGVEPTNDQGTSIHERIMTTLATWEQKGSNSPSANREASELNTYE